MNCKCSWVWFNWKETGSRKQIVDSISDSHGRPWLCQFKYLASAKQKKICAKKLVNICLLPETAAILIDKWTEMKNKKGKWKHCKNGQFCNWKL